MRKVTQPAPIAPMAFMLLTVAAGFGVLVVSGGNFALYAVVMAVGFVVSVAWGAMQARPVQRELRAAAKAGERIPTVDIAWPRWAKRTALAYAFVLALSFAVLLILLVAATIERALD